MAALKDCDAVRRDMSITYGPPGHCERCGDGPCTLTRPHAERHADAIRRKYGLDEQNRQRRIYWGSGR